MEKAVIFLVLISCTILLLIYSTEYQDVTTIKDMLFLIPKDLQIIRRFTHLPSSLLNMINAKAYSKVNSTNIRETLAKRDI